MEKHMNIGIIGLGLLGGSLGRAIVEKTGHKVYGLDISHDIMLKAEMLSAMHFPLTGQDYSKLDLLIIATFPRVFEKILNDTAPMLKNGACVIDIGGNKKGPVTAMRKSQKNHPHISFVATHPMAGKEGAGIDKSSPAIFEKSSMLMIPVAADVEVKASLKKLFIDLGFANVIFTDEIKHDRVIAYTSQLPHIIASCYIQSDTASEHHGFSAGSFCDISRVAKMNTSMWTELILDNKEQVLPELQSFIDRLTTFQNALSTNDEAKIKEIFENGNAQKERIESPKKDNK